MNKVRLKFKGLSEITGNEKIGIIVLTDMMEKREITIVSDENMIYQFSLRMKKIVGTDKLLPEVLFYMLKYQTDVTAEIVIYDIVDGQYLANVYNLNSMEPMKIRASDAVLLSFISDIPLYIEERLMMRQSVPYEIPSQNMALPLNTLDVEMLKDALDRAVKDEKYEMASQLRDELKRRIENATKLHKENEGS